MERAECCTSSVLYLTCIYAYLISSHVCLAWRDLWTEAYDNSPKLLHRHDNELRRDSPALGVASYHHGNDIRVKFGWYHSYHSVAASNRGCTACLFASLFAWHRQIRVKFEILQVSFFIYRFFAFKIHVSWQNKSFELKISLLHKLTWYW